MRTWPYNGMQWPADEFWFYIIEFNFLSSYGVKGLNKSGDISCTKCPKLAIHCRHLNTVWIQQLTYFLYNPLQYLKCVLESIFLVAQTA